MVALLLLFCAQETLPYRLPYEDGTSWLVGQGGMSNGTHKGKWAYDIMMPEGTKVCAVRGGRVVWIRQDTPDPPPGKAGTGKANVVTVEHEDGSTAMYIHIKCNSARVKVGDTVEQGQWICTSGNTGESPVAHLHLEMTGKNGKTFEPLFEDVDGRLQQGKKYLSGNIPGVPLETKNRLSALARAAKLAEAEGAWGLAYLAWKRFADEKLTVKYARQDEARARLKEIEKKADDAERTHRNKLAFEGVPTQAFEGVKKPGGIDAWDAFFKAFRLELEGKLAAARTAYKTLLVNKPPDDVKKRVQVRLEEIQKRLSPG